MKTILHMPHTSLKVPKHFYKGLTIDKVTFNKYNLFMSDLGINDLLKDVEGIKIRPKYSRLFCDVERFINDEDEVMARYGQGVIYTRTYDGVEFHRHDERYRKRVLKYYKKYHKKLDILCKKVLKKEDKILILDCHSFSDKMASNIKKGPFPDICIGIEKKYYDREIVKDVIKAIIEKGYTYRINYPYKGSLVPNCIYEGKVKGKVISLMLEINKRVYL